LAVLSAANFDWQGVIFRVACHFSACLKLGNELLPIIRCRAINL
jgi:hypothetical protein